jgi:hypothetical protein
VKSTPSSADGSGGCRDVEAEDTDNRLLESFYISHEIYMLELNMETEIEI